MNKKFLQNLIILLIALLEIPTIFRVIDAYNTEHVSFKRSSLHTNVNIENLKDNTEEANFTESSIDDPTKRFSKRSTPSSLPSPPEVIKFELSDAIEPDEATKEFFRKIREQMNMKNRHENMTNIQMMITNGTLPTAEEEDFEDQSSHESQKIKVYIPLRQEKRKARKSINVLPEEVQKIVNMLLKSEGEQKRQHSSQDIIGSATAVTPSNVLRYGDKLISSNDNENLRKFKSIFFKGGAMSTTDSPAYHPAEPKFHITNYIPVAAVKLKRVQLPTQSTSSAVDNKQFQPVVELHPVEMIKVIPQINYAIQEVPAPVLVSAQPISHKQLSGPFTAAIHNEVNIQPPADSSSSQEQSIDLYQQQQRQQQRQQQISYSNSLGHHNEGDVEQQQSASSNTIQHHHHEITNPLEYDNKYEELSELIGKNPVDQLQGLTYLLSNERLREFHQNFKSPEDNTAPIQFPMKDENLNHLHYQQQQQYKINDDESDKYEYNAVNDIASVPEYYKYAPPQPISSTPPPKMYTPVTEVNAENYPIHDIHSIERAKIVHITPPTISSSSYKTVHASGLSPNYKGISHDENGLQYASKYAFGYRVRDFHTGNDFSHRQNRDIDGVTRGEYHILLPDGRIQNVRYHADDSGFHADVQFESGH